MKKLLVLVLALAMAVAFAACGGGTTTSQAPATSAPAVVSTAPANPPVHINYNILEPNTHPQGITMLAFKTKVEELSGGNITVTTYPSGQLFTQEGEVPALTNGELDMSNIAFQDIANFYAPAGMFAAPYCFTSYEHMDKVFAEGSPVVEKFYPEVEKACNYTPIGYMCQGSRILDLKTEVPIMKPEDLAANKVVLRMPNAQAWLDAGQSLGATCQGIAYAETYTALQTGTVTAQDNPLPGTYAMKFYEVTKQISLTKHIIDVKLICVNTDLWNSLTDEQKGWMKEAAKYAGQQGSAATFATEEELLTFMRDEAKMIITEPDIAAFQAYSLQYYKDKGLTATWDMALYDMVQSLK